MYPSYCTIRASSHEWNLDWTDTLTLMKKRSTYIHANHSMQCQSSLSVALDEEDHTFIKSTCIGVTGHSVL